MEVRLTHTVVTAASIRMVTYLSVGTGLGLVAAVLAPGSCCRNDLCSPSGQGCLLWAPQLVAAVDAFEGAVLDQRSKGFIDAGE